MVGNSYSLKMTLSRGEKSRLLAMGLMPAEALLTMAISVGLAPIMRANAARISSYLPIHSSQGAAEVRQLLAYSAMPASTADDNAPCEQLYKYVFAERMGNWVRNPAT